MGVLTGLAGVAQLVLALSGETAEDESDEDAQPPGVNPDSG